MTDTIKAAATATAIVHHYVGSALLALEEFRLNSVNASGILMNPPTQLTHLRVAHDEIAKAIAAMEAAAWPSEADYHAL